MINVCVLHARPSIPFIGLTDAWLLLYSVPILTIGTELAMDNPG